MPDNIDKNPIPKSGQRNEDNTNLTGLIKKLSDKEKNVLFDLLESDPLDDFYKKGLIVYLNIATVLLLLPFDFFSSAPDNDAVWIKATNGIEFSKAGKIISDLPAKPLFNQMLTGSGLTLEIRAAPSSTDQYGPARIVSYSLDSSRRNFMLGQSQHKLIMRLRTSITDKNGIYPHLEVDDVFTSTDPYHLMITYDFSKQRIYANGEIRAENTIPGGNFSNWDPSCYLVLGNEVTGERSWAGRLFYVSIYNRVLEPHEIRQNFIAWALWKPDSQKIKNLVSSGLVVRYFFNEHAGDIVKDSSGNLPPINLNIPEKLRPNKKRFLGFSSFSHFTDIYNTSLNIIIFIPFSFLLSGAVRKKGYSLVCTYFIVIIAGILFTISIESIQYFSATRTSTLVDVAYNTIGTIVGVVLFGVWKKKLKSQSRQLY